MQGPDELDRKLLVLFQGKVVRKDLVLPLRGEYQVPNYVLEFLLGRYCSSLDESEISGGRRHVQRVLTEHFVRSDQAPHVQALLRERGRFALIDKVKVRLAPREDRYWAELVQLRISDAVLPDDLATRYPRLLMGGCWAQLELCYMPDSVHKRNVYPFVIERLVPLQVESGGLGEVQAKRGAFTAAEWKRLLLRSLGLAPEALSERQMDLYLLRMVPYVEDNFNLVEFGPRGTGKSYCYRELSPYAILISGGETSVANLFGANIGKTLKSGLVNLWDVVAFDEVAGLSRVSDPQQFQILKDYMESGSYSRGREPVSATASLVFEGNLDVDVEVALRTSHLFSPFPRSVRNDRAFLDRIHAYLPGWELPRMRSDMMTRHYGFIVEYLADVLRALRGASFADAPGTYFRLGPALDYRDERAVRRTVSGLLKLVCPHGEFGPEEVRWALELALESRRRVKEQLKRMGGMEYWQTHFSYGLLGGHEPEREVLLPEQGQGPSRGGLFSADEMPAGRLYALGRDAADRRPCVFRIEVELGPGSGRASLSGVRSQAVQDALQAAHHHIRNRAAELGAARPVLRKDLHVQILNLMEASEPAGLGLGILLAMVSALRGIPVARGVAVLGDMSVQGSILPPEVVGETVLLAREGGARTLYVPAAAWDDFDALPRDLIEGLSVYHFASPAELVAAVLDEAEEARAAVPIPEPE